MEIVMDNHEKKLIENLFSQMREIQYKDYSRDSAAEKLINQLMNEQPSALYYMVRAALIQEEMIKNLNKRVGELENSSSRGQRSSFLSGIFKKSSIRKESNQYPEHATNLRMAAGSSSSSFLGGALQTAIGVGSGILMADAIRNLISSPQEDAMENINDVSAIESSEHCNSSMDSETAYQENVVDSGYISGMEQNDFDSFVDDDSI
jgi:hypothetical protein